MPPPTHNPRASLQVSMGRFVRRKGRTMLVDSLTGHVHSIERVRVVMGGWGDTVEGCVKLPRARVDDLTTGKNLVIGDLVLIAFLRSNPDRPIILGGIRPVGDDAFLSRDHNATDADENALRLLLVARDGQGNKGGQIKLAANGGAGGTATLALSEGMRVEVATDLNTAGAVSLELDGQGATVSAGGVTEPVILGRTFLTDLSAGLTEVQAILLGLGIPTPNLTSLLTKTATALGGTGAPYLAKHLDVE